MFLFCGNLWRIYGFVLFGFCSDRIDIYIYSSNGLCCFRCFVLWYLFGNVWKIRRYNMTQLTGWMIIYGIQWDTLGYGIWLHDAKEHEGFDLCRMMLMVWCFVFCLGWSMDNHNKHHRWEWRWHFGKASIRYRHVSRTSRKT